MTSLSGCRLGRISGSDRARLGICYRTPPAWGGRLARSRLVGSPSPSGSASGSSSPFPFSLTLLPCLVFLPWRRRLGERQRHSSRLRPTLCRRRASTRKASHSQMKHIFKIVAILVAISAIWVALLETSTVPRSYTWLLPIYLVVALGCYGLFMVGFGLMFFPTCPQEAILLQQDIVEAKEFLAKKGVDVGSE